MKEKKERLTTLREKKEKLEKQLAALEARERAKARKEETRLKVLIGAAVLADAKVHPENITNIEAILQRAVIAPRDRSFLQEKGWLSVKQ